MIDPVSTGASATAASPLTLVAPSSSASGDPTPPASNAPGPSASAPSSQATTRIYVDRSDSGIYVYRLVDVATGRVLAELPRDASQSLKVLDAYAPGAVTSASV